MRTGTFWENVRRRITAIVFLYNQAESQNISNRAKSAYYRAATLLAGSVIEGLVYQLAKITSAAENNVLEKHNKKVEIHRIPGAVFGMNQDIVICKNQKESMCIDDNGVDFGKLNLYLKNKGVISTKEYRALDVVRRDRNKIHVQGLEKDDVGHTKTRFNKMTMPADFLTKKIDLAVSNSTNS